MKLFNDNPSHSTRALQIWQILIAKASNRQTLTYGQLAKILGFQGAGTLAPILGHIMYYCQQENLPPLTVIVVNQKTGLPGDGLTNADLNADREAVFQYDWFGVFPPTPEELDQAHKIGFKNAQT
jgi:alkylated DNA nucleotide flippase Atl1